MNKIRIHKTEREIIFIKNEIIYSYLQFNYILLNLIKLIIHLEDLEIRFYIEILIQKIKAYCNQRNQEF